jgi:translation initiation factor 2B subunit (eIF-2B alpha/beta/delta family)
VIEILKEISKNNKNLRLIIPECRIVKGGQCVLQEVRPLGFNVHLIPDCSVGYFLPKTEAVLMGAETVHVDGSFINTIGSKQIACSASKNQIPVYVACESTKIDEDSLYGTHRKMIWRDMEVTKEEVGNANFCADYPLGVCVPSIYVTGYITDIGVIPPTAIWSIVWCEAENRRLNKEVR